MNVTRACRRHPVRVAAAALLAALVLAGCTGGDGDGGSGAGPSTTAAPTAAPTADVTVAAINLLHGLFCPEATDGCSAPARLQLLLREIEDAGCPDVVGLGEVGPRQLDLLPGAMPELCDGRYTLLWDPVAEGEQLDMGALLTTLPVVEHGYLELSGFPWGGYRARLRAPVGIVDVVTAHLASSVNNPPCTPESCPPICPAGEETGTCQSRELLAALEPGAAEARMQIVMGDLNQPVDHPRITTLTDAGFRDAWLEAGNAECDPATGRGCTCCISSGTEDWDGGGLRDPAGSRTERIDLVLVRPGPDCDLTVDTSEDADGDGAATAQFAHDPADPPVDGLLWPSDHSGVTADLTC